MPAAVCRHALARTLKNPAGTKRWHESLVTILDADFTGTGFQARWEYFNCGCGDVLIRLEQSAPDGVQTGELLLMAAGWWPRAAGSAANTGPGARCCQRRP